VRCAVASVKDERPPAIAGALAIRAGEIEQAGIGEMVGKELGFRLSEDREIRHDRSCDHLMQLLTSCAEQVS
jgi:hypothetical protein